MSAPSAINVQGQEQEQEQEQDVKSIAKVLIKDASGQVAATPTIQRSFPKAKGNKLLEELSILLSVPKIQSTLNVRWTLTPNGDGIRCNIVIKDAAIQTFQTKISRTTKEMNHNPHIAKLWSDMIGAWIVSILCTTHQPAGLSLKDARLANAITYIAVDLNSSIQSGAVQPVEHSSSLLLEEIIKSLQKANVDAAHNAVLDPNSKCATSARS